MKNFSAWTVCLAVLLLGGAEAARLYKWVDENGNVSYHDRPPSDNGTYRVEQKNFKTEADRGDSPKDVRDAVRNFPVTLYTANKCASCDLVRDYLGKQKVPFTEKNVQTNLEFNKELEGLIGSVGVPTVKIGKKTLTGFTRDWIESELTQAGYLEDAPREQDIPGQQEQ